MHKLKSDKYKISITTVSVILAMLITAVAASEISENIQSGQNEIEETEGVRIAGRIYADTLIPDREGALNYLLPDEDDVLISSNDQYELFLNYDDFAIKVRNKATGYIWDSIVSDENIERVSRSWRNFAQSMIAGDFITISSGYAKNRVTIFDKEGTMPEISLTDDGFKAAVTFPEVEVSCELIVSLTEEGLNVRVPFESIRQGDVYALSALHIMPMFGAAWEDSIPGYILIPDGSGALIRFEKALNYTSSYAAKIYGRDLGVKEYTLKTDFETLPTVDDEQVMMPVFGIAHGKNKEAFLAVIEDGELSCEITAAPAGTEVSYSRAYPRFVYRETFWQPTGGVAGFYLIQSDTNMIDAQVGYVFLTGDEANYTGMANKYAEQLFAASLLPAVDEIDYGAGDIPLKLDIVIAEQAEGFFASVTKVLTRFDDVSKWVNDLSGSSVRNVYYTLTGSEKGGSSGHKIGEYDIEKKAGSEEDLKLLSTGIATSGGKLIFRTDLTSGYSHQLSKKNIKFRESGQFAMTLDTSLLFKERMFLNDITVFSVISGLMNTPDHMKAFALDSIAMSLISNYRAQSVTNRIDTLGNVRNSLEKAKANTEFLMLQEPNVYAAKYAGAIYDVPLTHSKLMFERDAVPFIQTVYSGRIECFSENLNYAGDDIHPLLKLIEFNTYPSYILSDAQSSEFADTNSNHIYSSQYSDWKDDIISGYKFVDGILSEVRGCTVVSRDVPAAGISVTMYSNGVLIAVNFNDDAYMYNGTIIKPVSAVILRKGA